MKLFKKRLIFLCLVLAGFASFGQVVGYEEARQKAIRVLQQMNMEQGSLKYAAVLEVDTFATWYVKGKAPLKNAAMVKEPALYIFNRKDQPGFVIVSGEKRVRDIIAYSNANSFTNPNPGLLTLLNQYVDEISFAKDNNCPAVNSTINDDQYTPGSWLLGDIGWDQNPDPFNTLCPPKDKSEHCVTGCLATVLGQIMYYYKYPRKGSGYNSYPSTFGTESANFGAAEYKYELMEDKPANNTQNPEIAQLLYHCGVSLNMEYGLTISTQTADYLPIALRNYFEYSCFDLLFFDNNREAWRARIINEINNKRPVAYAGTGPGGGTGHIFIVDGYNGTDEFHINWGWGNCSDGFYSLDLLEPNRCNKGQNYSYNNHMVIGIEPKYPDVTGPWVTTSQHNDDLQAAISLIFDEPLDRKTVIPENIILEGEKSGIVPFIHTYFDATRRLIIVPVNSFHHKEKVTLTLRAKVTDLVGNPLDNDKDGFDGPDFPYEFTTVGFPLDYTVTSLTVSDQHPDIGEEVQLTAVIKNIGTSEGPANQMLNLFDNSHLNLSVTGFPSLQPGEEHPVTLTWIAEPGLHELQVEIALTGDQDDSDDYLSTTLNIPTSGGLTLDGSTELLVKTALRAGTAIDLTLLLTNPGTADISATVSSSGVAGSWISPESGLPFELPAGQSKNYTFQILAPVGTAPGIYNAAIRFDYAGQTQGTNIYLTISVLGSVNGTATFEYWFDGNFGARNRSTASLSNNWLNKNLVTSGLSLGLHMLNIRFRDKFGQWSQVISEPFMKYPTRLNHELEIRRYEYWLDDDFTSRKSVSVRAAETFSLKYLNLKGFPTGHHTLHFRFRDNAGQWGAVNSEMINIYPERLNDSPMLSGYEYWFNDNYLQRKTGSFAPEETFSMSTLDLGELSEGSHLLHIRYRDNAGHWSSVNSDWIRKLPLRLSDGNSLLAYRYWFDQNDGNKVTVNLSGPENPYLLTQNIIPESLTGGEHFIHFQFLDQNGVWSIVTTDKVTKPVISNSRLDLKVFLEGPYDSGTGLMGTALNTGNQIPLNQPFNMAPWNYAGTESVTSIPSGVTDWVLVELRDAATPAEATTSFLQMACFLKSDGTIARLDGTSLPGMGSYTVTNNLYVVVRHRNHIAVMSSEGLVPSGNTYAYDFTVAIAKAYNGAAGYKQIATGVFGMVAGDADADGSVYPSDYNQWASKYNSTGYKNSDFDMDTNVYPSDYNKWATNYNKGNPLLKSSGKVKYRSQVPGDN